MKVSWSSLMSNTIVVSERRRTWPDELKLQMLSEAEAPGESVCSVARRYEIDPAQMYQWRKKFRSRATEPVTLLPIEVTAEAAVSSPPASSPSVKVEDHRLEVACKSGHHLFAPVSIDPKRLASLVAALEMT